MWVGGMRGRVPSGGLPRGKVGAAAAVCLWLLLGGCGSEAERGASLYAQRCLTCHGSEGAGDGSRAAFLPGKVPDLRKSSLSEEELRRVVSEGRKNGLMPAFGPALKEDEVRDVVAYIQRFRTP